MAYATRTQLTQHGLPSAALTNVPTATQDAALEAASRKIDSYLRSRYSVPLLNPEEAIVEATCVLASCSILTTKGHNPTFYDEVFERRCDKTIEWLEDLSKGIATLDPDEDASPGVAEGAPDANSRGPVVTFSSTIETNTPRGW